MVQLTEEQQEQIQILQSFLDQGLMDPEDFGTFFFHNINIKHYIVKY